ncbi:hypothetical protein AMV265 [Betaentomopoxvirus amoorei]|uniref:AMV265 n=1 Tax=Amsacta moorei entomopoxvirus TaxID=28321 RepID=Q9EME1_AMEPV|nr:hypothetical protein AMV265 [Amsacta moorei entomopoxvirus]AAG02971.1 AMV265 [Amsacta moorei entomopoxvirus]
MDSIDKINIDIYIKNDTIILYGLMIGYFLRICKPICDINNKLLDTHFEYFTLDAIDKYQILNINNTLIFNNKKLTFNNELKTYIYDNDPVFTSSCQKTTNSRLLYMKRIKIYYEKNNYLSSDDYNIDDMKCEYDKYICDIKKHKLFYTYIIWSEIDKKDLIKTINADVDLVNNGKYYNINIKTENISITIPKEYIKINNKFSYDQYIIKIKKIYKQNKKINVDNIYKIISNISDNNNVIPHNNTNNNNNNNNTLYILYYICIIIIILLLLYISLIIIIYIKNVKKKKIKNNYYKDNIYVELDEL